MKLTEVLRPEHIVAPLQAATVREAVLALIEHLRTTGDIARPAMLDRLTREERIRDTVRVGENVLLPHMRTRAVNRLVVAIGIAPEPLREVAGEPGTAQIVVLVLAPPSASDMYLQTVASIARALRDRDTVERLIAAGSGSEALSLPALRDLVVQPRLTVRDVMTQRVYRVNPETPARELLDLMIRHNLNAVPVVSPTREVLGIVTERDLLRHLLACIVRAGGPAGEHPDDPLGPMGDTPVRDIMTRSVMCISEDQALADVTSIMINKDVERVPVVSEGQLTGFLTRSDIIRKLFGR